MRRVLLSVLSTVSVVTLLFGYHTSTEGALTAASPPSVIGPATTGSSASAASPSAAPSSSSSSASSSSSSSSTTSTTGSGGSTAQTVTGPVVQTEWGPVQVALTVRAGSVTDVQVLQYPSGNPRDEEINAYALPVLVQETLEQQSASIDMVSGATITSTGYVQSLQAALDRAHV